MSQGRLPGPSTMAALMLAVILVTWLGLWGPVDLEKIKPWQTLIAALVALGAASLAYRGAMAKVNFDRDVHEAQLRQRKKNLHTKLIYAATIFAVQMREAARRFSPRHPFGKVERMAKDFSVNWPPEFDEAWINIDLLDEASAGLLANLKYNCNLLREASDGLDQTKTWQFDWVVPTEIEGAVKLIKDVDSFATDFAKSLQSSKAY